MEIPERAEFIRGSEEFVRREGRHPMYKVATFLLDHYWGKPADMADGLGVLLLTWNQAFYRYGVFDFDHLEQCIARNMESLNNYRARDILSFKPRDEAEIRQLFDEFLDALQSARGTMPGRKSPVAVAKALHLLAPTFFPLWDDKIAKGYRCYYQKDAAGKYLQFCLIIKDFAERVQDYTNASGRTLVKLIDEYNYSKYTQRWI